MSTYGIRLPKLLQKGCVLQRGEKTRVWGWCDPGQEVQIQLQGKNGSALADAQGRFEAYLENLLPGGPFTLLIGVEFVKMLAKHTAENLLEVLMFAIARQMVVEHLNMTETLIGVVAIAVIFSIRKFLLLKTSDSAEKMYDKL